MKFINKHELKYIIYAVIFSLAWFSFILPKVIDKIDGTSPYLQFFIFNISIFIVLQIILKSHSIGGSIDWVGGLGIICLFVALDIYMPPLMVGFDGTLETGSLLYASSSDYVAGYFATNSLHLSGMGVFLFTYIFTPFVLLIIASKILPNFVKHL